MFMTNGLSEEYLAQEWQSTEVSEQWWLSDGGSGDDGGGGGGGSGDLRYDGI
jgi:hypothetical protein